jgi:uncharacterized phage-associated protein
MAAVGDVAAYIEEKLGPQSAYKLQKLVYYAQAWSLAWDDAPLFPNVIKAWPEGPVAPELWHDRKQGLKGFATALNADEVATVDAVLDFYGAMSARDLIELSHRETPWRDARAGLAPSEPSKTAISLDTMKSYYAPLAHGHDKRIPDEVRCGVRLLLSTPIDAIDDLLKIDHVTGERAVRWLESGEGDPWNESSV